MKIHQRLLKYIWSSAKHYAISSYASKSLLGFERLNSFGITSSWAFSILKLSSWRGWKQPTSYGIVDNLKTWLTSVIPFLPFFLLYIKKVIKGPPPQRIPLKTTNSHNSRILLRTVDQKTLVKRRKLRWTVYVLTLSLSLPDTSSQIFDRKPSAEPCQTLFLSLWPE